MDLPDPVKEHNYNIIFADDISQIVTGRHVNYIQQRVEDEVRNINTFENKWKIKTNTNKFQVVALDGKRADMRYTIGAQQHVSASSTGRFLGFHIHRSGVPTAARQRAVVAGKELARLRRFYTLSSHAKKRLYTAKIRSKLTYPVSPWSSLTSKQLHPLQKTQNMAVNFIGNYNWTQFITQATKHEQHGMEPIGYTIHQQNTKIWNKLMHKFPDIIHNLANEAARLNNMGRFMNGWQSSLLTIFSPPYFHHTQAEANNIQ